jgi:leader peptidase (prepilin peptidase)/N-methyltransferase
VVRATGFAWRAAGLLGRLLAVAGIVATVVLTVAWVPRSSAAVATGGSLLALVIAALVDAVVHRLPNALVMAAAAPVLVTLVLRGDLVGEAIAGAALLGGPLLVTHLVAPSGMGFGDVKAGTVLGAALGLLAGSLALVALVIGLLAAATFGLLGRRRAIALGPALVLGALLAVVLGYVAGVAS